MYCLKQNSLRWPTFVFTTSDTGKTNLELEKIFLILPRIIMYFLTTLFSVNILDGERDIQMHVWQEQSKLSRFSLCY